jgi:peptidoglycan hydrolase-like protein with peptidoglycan-binding domain
VQLVRRGGVHRRSRRTVVSRRAAAPGLAALTALGLLVGTAANAPAAGAAPIPDPVAPKAAPAVVETFTPYLPQASCDPTIKPGTAALRTTLMGTYGGRDLGVTRSCDIGALSEHKEGRAWDWGLSAANPTEKAIAQQFLGWLLAKGPDGAAAYNARRLGVMYVIWDGKIWSAYRVKEGWRAYSGGEAHADHIHISLAWNGAMKRTSWWTGTTAATDFGPCPSIAGQLAAPYSGPRYTACPTPIDPMTLTGTPVLKREARGAYVVQLQRLLRVTPVSGYFGPVTDTAVRAFQTAHGIPATGATYLRTWAALRNPSSTTTPPATTKATPNSAKAFPTLLQRMTYTVKRGDTLGGIAKHWRSSVTAIKTVNKLRSDTIRTGQVLTLPVRSWLTKYSWTTIRKGNHNKTVRALQTALRMPKKYRTSRYGDITKGYVKRLERASRLRVDGIAGPEVWRRLGA